MTLCRRRHGHSLSPKCSLQFDSGATHSVSLPHIARSLSHVCTTIPLRACSPPPRRSGNPLDVLVAATTPRPGQLG